MDDIHFCGNGFAPPTENTDLVCQVCNPSFGGINTSGGKFRHWGDDATVSLDGNNAHVLLTKPDGSLTTRAAKDHHAPILWKNNVLLAQKAVR